MSLIDRVCTKFHIDKKAATALLIGSVMAVMIGSVLLVVTYTVLDTVFNVATTSIATSSTGPNGALLNTSMHGNFSVITQALNIIGISLIVVGIGGIIYMLMGVAGVGGGGGRYYR